MNVLVIGATGFVGSQIVTDLIAAKHTVTCCVRDEARAKNIFPSATIVRCDFVHDTSIDVWMDRLKETDVVINCVGILHHPNKKTLWAIHHDTPCALFDACVLMDIKKVIHISALGVDKVDAEYAKSKKATDDYLQQLSIKSVILRPSFVYGRGSYGGSSLFRGLAALPWILPVPGNGAQEFQPIHVKDLSRGVVRLVNTEIDHSLILNAVGPKRIQLNLVLRKTRAWLGFPKAFLVKVPSFFIRIMSVFGNFFPYSALNTNSYKMLNRDSITSDQVASQFHQTIGFIPRDFTTGLLSEPSTVQDHWHARLYFVKPILQYSIAFVWLFSAACSTIFYPHAASHHLLTQLGIDTAWQPMLLYGASTLDALLGLSMLCGYQLKKSCRLQVVVILLYSIIITWALPQLWLEPFAPIAKNIPLIAAILAFSAIASDR